MRNWNLVSAPSHPAPSKSIYRTYEELKFVKKGGIKKWVKLHLPYLWGIEMTEPILSLTPWTKRIYRTYEELKSVPYPGARSYLPSIYRTYEELKHSLRCAYYIYSNEHLLYLWGVKTLSSYSQINQEPVAFTIPMRS